LGRGNNSRSIGRNSGISFEEVWKALKGEEKMNWETIIVAVVLAVIVVYAVEKMGVFKV
jgi:hypothetical protein